MTLVVDVAGPLAVSADPVRLRQVLLNIGSNAIKYNRPGGSVRFHATRTDDGQVLLGVADSGVGMTAAQTSRLFQPFDRLGQEHGNTPGIGLGLVIARDLVVEMGGTLAVSSQPGVGTEVTIRLPTAG